MPYNEIKPNQIYFICAKASYCLLSLQYLVVVAIRKFSAYLAEVFGYADWTSSKV